MTVHEPSRLAPNATSPAGQSRAATGKLVFLALGLVVGAFVGGGVTWVVGSKMRSRLEEAGRVERERTLEVNRRVLLERGWNAERAGSGLEPASMPAALVGVGLEACEREQRDLPELVGRRLAREALESSPR